MSGPPAWRQATRKPTGVEIQYRKWDVAIRRHMYGAPGRALLIPRSEWHEFLEAVKDGRMDEEL